MKRLMAFVITVAAVATACGGGQPAGPKKLRFALIPKALDIPVFDYANKGAQRFAKDAGNIDVTYLGPERADALKQKEILESFISQKVDGIAISVLDADFLTSTIDKAVDAGIPVVTWDSDAPRSKRAAFYGVDDFKSGQIMGEETARLLHGKGTVAILTSLGANNLQQRLEGVKAALVRYPDMKIVDTFDIKEDSTRCLELIETGTNRYPNLGAWVSVGGWPVFSANSVKPVDPKKTKFVSFDTVPTAIDILRSGKIQVLLGQKYFGWGSESIRLLVDIHNGKMPPSPIVDSGVDVVTAANVDEYVAKWNKMAGGG